MKKRIILSVVVIALVVAAILLIFNCKKTEGYLSVIPNNSAIVFKVNVQNVLNESEILENPILKPFLTASSGESAEGTNNLFENIIENPQESGLDLSRPVVFALTALNPTKAVMTIAVSDKAKLENVFDELSGGSMDITSNGDVNVIETGETEISVAYDDEKLVFAFAEEGADVLEYFNSAAGKNSDNEELLSFFRSSDDAALYISGPETYLNISNDKSLQYLMRKKEIELLKDIVATVTLNFEKGFAELAVNMVLPEEFKVYEKFQQPSSKKHLKYVPEDAFFLLDVSCNFESLESELTPEDKLQIEEMLTSLGLDFSLFKSIVGDVTFAMLQPDFSVSNDIPFMGILDCSDPALIDSIVRIAGMLLKVEEVEEGVYDLNIMNRGNDYYIAHKDNKLLFLPENIYVSLKKGDSLVPLRSNILDNENVESMGNAAFLDFGNFCKATAGDRTFSDYSMIFSALEYAVFEAESAERVTLRVTTKDKNVNFLKFAVDKAIETTMMMNFR